MKKTIFTFLLLLISFISYSQSSDDFIYVTTSVDKNDFYVLLEKNDDNTKEFWLKSVNPTKYVKGKNGKRVLTGGGYSLEYIIMDCSDKTYSTSNMVSYQKNKVTSRPDYLNTFNERIIPGSVMSAVYLYVCDIE